MLEWESWTYWEIEELLEEPHLLSWDKLLESEVRAPPPLNGKDYDFIHYIDAQAHYGSDRVNLAHQVVFLVIIPTIHLDLHEGHTIGAPYLSEVH